MRSRDGPLGLSSMMSTDVARCWQGLLCPKAIRIQKMGVGWSWEDEHVMGLGDILNCYVQSKVGSVGTVRGEVTLAQQGPTTDRPMIFYELTTRSVSTMIFYERKI